ncbi:extracellular solute-binding protein [Paenibacillus roseipurpureus]|uniref:Extracellular solute-binding protein n=1 Tax=Paenibacillus roseopurpureus TaxID=2918901 RepID=A0AA96LKZ4_9BACL|nr:extracellular solute-binding protein [Paenibacillus sp. MBLB1832]WNR42968.1 extracellular solute-binding protein [Paenibacillus sp. MBLB1832]
MSKLKLLSTALSMMIVGLTGCSAANTANTDASASKETPTVTIMSIRDINYEDNNPINQELAKRTGIQAKWIWVPSSEYQTKLNTMIASNDLPDIIYYDSPSKLVEMANNNVIIPLDDLLKQHGKHILENKGDYLKGAATVNGKVFGIPQARDIGGESLAIRKDWMDKLGLKTPGTLEEYYIALKAFKEKDPDGNGKQDTIPLGLTLDYPNTFNHIFGAFGISMDWNRERGQYIDGKVLPAILQPGFLDAIKYYNKLYNEGLVEPEFSTIKGVPEYTKLWTGNMGSFNFQPPGTTQNWLARYTENPKPVFAYTVIKGTGGIGGQIKKYNEDGPFVSITSKSKNPTAAMKLMDYLISPEGDQLIFCGLEGTHYKMVNGQCQKLEPYTDPAKIADQGVAIYYGLMYRVKGMEFQNFNDVTKEGIQVALNNTLKDPHLRQIPEVELNQGKIMTDIVKEFVASAVTSKGNLDQMYESYKKKYMDAGGTKWIEQATEIYKKENNIK